jgi:cell division protein FtsA
MVLALGGNHITSDIAHGLRLPISQAEDIKKQYGHAIESEVGAEETFSVRTFADERPVQVSRKELAHITEARAEEIFMLVLQEIKRSGYDGLLPAGMVLTGGSSLLPGIRALASQVLGVPVRIARPENLVGLTDQLNSPAYSTSVGLLNWALMMSETGPRTGIRDSSPKGVPDLGSLKGWLKRLLP